jgi:hypothetical protein
MGSKHRPRCNRQSGGSMIRHILIGLVLLSLPRLSDAIVDYRFSHEQHGYSQSDVADMNRLIDHVTTAKPVRHKKAWTAQQEAAAVDALFGRRGTN